MSEKSNKLDKSLGPVMIWGLGVGYVISGEYFGWNLGLPHGGPYGMLVATILVTIMYVTFVLGYSEVACSIPKAGGAFVYTKRAYGKDLGFIAGVSQLIEFVFAPPAIALAIGAYFQNYLPNIDAIYIALIAYIVFTSINIFGVKQSAIFELFITIFAVIELLIFSGVSLPKFSLEAFNTNPLPNGWSGIFPSIPFAIWFYLAIEGVANIAEEAKNPQRDISRGFSLAMATLVVLAGLVFFSSIGVGGWEKIVYNADGTTSDSPLPMALELIVGKNHFLYHLLITVGLFGLIASFHGIILVAGRATFEFGRVGYLPKMFGRTLENRKTPANALILNMFIGFIALATGKTGEIITIAAFGALTLYILSTLSLMKLRKTEPNLERPYKTPLYPITPIVSLSLSIFCMIAMSVYNFKIAMIYSSILLISWVIFKILKLD